MDPSQTMTRAVAALAVTGHAEDILAQRYGISSRAAHNMLTRLSGRYKKSVALIADQLVSGRDGAGSDGQRADEPTTMPGQRPTGARRDGVKIVDKALTRC
ncbi:ANTAR domain-containing protein [Mycobacterium simiae]|uniref:ANTAR domain-containing protein n=1 Tax=Mycobacterium simiae TaxID=1784 RepID=A0A5B1BLX1_MYCSI|nr:ANTAR domain-containing protein [Mycobacterium simiae]KAA1249456.1 ANTAR domain-containing protein [Mycobacterium simiae]